jgi:hypothetical protein
MPRGDSRSSLLFLSHTGVPCTRMQLKRSRASEATEAIAVLIGAILLTAVVMLVVILTRQPTLSIDTDPVQWQAVDDRRGYAAYRITNDGTDAVTVRCNVVVENEFGNFGIGSITEQLDPGESASGRVPIDVGTGSFLITRGKVTDCEAAD